MPHNFTQKLNKLAIPNEVPPEDRLLFYGLSIVVVLAWWTELGISNIGFSLCSASTLAFSLWQCLRVLFPNTQQLDFFIPEKFTPTLIGFFWLALSFFMPDAAILAETDSASIIVFILLSVIFLFSTVPLGLYIVYAFSAPVLFALNYLVINSHWEDSLNIALLMDFNFVVLWYGAARAEKMMRQEKANLSIDEASQELTLLRDSIQNEAHIRASVEAKLAQKEDNLERVISERTKELRETNMQLGQQAALRKRISDALVKSQTRLTQAIDASHLGLIDWDIMQGQFYQSAFHSLYGEKEQTTEQVIQTLKKIIHPADYIEVRDTLNACLDGSRSEYQIQYRVKDDKNWIWIEECGKTVDHDSKGRAERILGTRRDIHSEVLRDEQVRLAKAVFDQTSEGVFVLDQDACFLSVNPAYSAITGHDAGWLVGRSILDTSETPNRSDVFNQLLHEVKEKGQWKGELLEKRRHGDYFTQWTQINAIFDERGNTKYYAGLVSDLTDLKATDKKLDYLINYDDLTKLANRVQFKDQLHRALLRYKDKHIPFVLVVLDVDRFKQFNDSFGHEAADQLLCEIADRLSKSVQKVDILARVGGNEFACIVANSLKFDPLDFAERLFKTVTAKLYVVDKQEIALSCSIGVALVPEHAEDIETLMQNASLAVQKAKYQGGDQIQLFDTSLESFSRQRLEMEHALRKAFSNKELEVYYQPKLDVSQSKIRSVEALIRWNHPTKGQISPVEFVNIAEESGLISELGAYVLQAACHQTQAWEAKGLGQLSVSVNLSPRQLRDVGLEALIVNTIETTTIPAENLELELTENAIMEDMKGAVKLLSALRKIGIKISIDDFGTGYSSLSYLNELPLDILKIDRSFIEGIENSKAQKAIVKAIIVLGNNLNLKIVAEGIENEAQLSLLSSYGCDFIQGYLVSKPLTAHDMERVLISQIPKML
ncbi:MAG: diguanylate cyclase (GGDEF)-like protein/PAS domain S-box-containing protein [Oleiphilaceae bacterium]|jgi:diguanylate cyclase (GGDEF)-like protein/PAS domain S-box-containing protein